MIAVMTQLLPPYESALEAYLDGGGESELLAAYEIGRQAMTQGLGVLESAALHQEALVAIVFRKLAPAENVRIARRASEFFAESLAPFEMTRRGFAEANGILRGLNSELEKRVQERTQELEKTLAELRSSEALLSERQRIERIKDDFIDLVSHELRTPMTSIHGALGLIAAGKSGEIPPEAKALVDIALRNSERLVRLIAGILDLQKIEAGKFELRLQPVEIVPIVEQAIVANQAFADQYEVSFVLRHRVDGTKVLAEVDPLIQVLTNLLSNAAKFSPRGGVVEVEIRRNEARVRTEVLDRGPGIPESFRSRMFQKFAQADSSSTRLQGGTGLGLSIAKALVERMRGQIGWEPRESGGSVFYFELMERGNANDQLDRGPLEST